MIRNCCMLVAGLLLHTQIFAQDKTAASRTGEDYTLSNGAVEAVFSGSGSFDIEKLVLDGKQVVGAGRNETPWILIYKGTQGENPELKPEHAVYRGVQVRDDAQAKTLVFTWELTLDYSPVKYPVRMYVTLPDGGELLQLEATQAANNLDEAQLEIRLAESSLAAADENLRLSRRQYEAGVETLSDHLEAQAMWQQAHQTEVEARIDGYLRWLEYRKAAGLLD